MWVCVRKKKKKVKMRQRERKRERGREDLFNREDWGGHVFFFSFKREMTDGKRGLEEKKVGKRRLKGLTSR